MKLYQMVLRGVMRRKKRVLLAVIGVLIGIMTVVGIFTNDKVVMKGNDLLAAYEEALLPG